ncbi:hypothetical protein ONZ51_g12783 [Trametes cubensis]|uniref:Uncharacterized protein n=1 Tax=Trametes cubensis TaxID=1111947 RepID=A0AAD7X555_9APHY|nr:hypothetical protein ONZ51_g12783 [Trametes cubensis]
MSTLVKQRVFWARIARGRRSDIPEDADIFTLYTIANADREEWADKTYQQVKAELVDPEWQIHVEESGDGEEDARHRFDEFMDTEIEVTGEKPFPGDPNVKHIPIPNSNYLLRFWPGSLASAEYCMDFVETQPNGERTAVNAPEGYAIRAAPMAPWMATVCTEIKSIERAYGVAPERIKPGEEKFILRDGMVCQLVRGGEVLFNFEVPSRPGVFGGVDILRPTRA